MANSYPYGVVQDGNQGGGYPSTTARVQFYYNGSTLFRTLYLTKASGISTWSYSTVIAAGKYKIVATDTFAQVDETIPAPPTTTVTLLAQPTQINFTGLAKGVRLPPPDNKEHKDAVVPWRGICRNLLKAEGASAAPAKWHFDHAATVQLTIVEDADKTPDDGSWCPGCP
jgi:hypothetical protein